MTDVSATPADLPVPETPAIPGIGRRLIAMVYESFLLLAVLMLAAALFMLVTRNSQAPVVQHARNAFLFLVTAAYFIHFWTDSGHTLAMKTWRMRLVADGFHRVPLRTAALRYLLAWGWFLPALIVCGALGLKPKENTGQVALAILIGIAAWACTAWFDADRRFLHDRIAGTRIIGLPKRKRA
jgi:uncharacterized RDD family membrane protein YckC